MGGRNGQLARLCNSARKKTQAHRKRHFSIINAAGSRRKLRGPLFVRAENARFAAVTRIAFIAKAEKSRALRADREGAIPTSFLITAGFAISDPQRGFFARPNTAADSRRKCRLHLFAQAETAASRRYVERELRTTIQIGRIPPEVKTTIPRACMKALGESQWPTRVRMQFRAQENPCPNKKKRHFATINRYAALMWKLRNSSIGRPENRI